MIQKRRMPSSSSQPGSQIRPVLPPITKSEALAVLFMLHLRHRISWRPSEADLDDERRFIIRRWESWIDCTCGCGRRLNFANDRGLVDDRGNTRKCKALEFNREQPGLLSQLIGKHHKGQADDEKNRAAWKTKTRLSDS